MQKIYFFSTSLPICEFALAAAVPLTFSRVFAGSACQLVHRRYAPLQRDLVSATKRHRRNSFKLCRPVSWTPQQETLATDRKVLVLSFFLAGSVFSNR